ncbi:MAG: hypothetical protein RLP44_25625 [Aggregatilineales bacterium]
MSAEGDKLVRDGIKAYRAGRKSEARLLLEQATEHDPENEQGWMWLSAVVDSEEDQRICLENVLFLNPNNENARRGLQILEQKSGQGSTSSTASDEDVFANSSFTATASPPDPAPPSASATFVPPTATSSASSTFQPEEPEPEIYDDWVVGLNLGGSETATEATYQEDQFLDDFEFNDVFTDAFGEDDDEDDHNNAGNSRLDSLMSDDDMLSGPFNADIFTADPFSTDEYEAVPSRKQMVDNDEDFDPFSDDFLDDPDFVASSSKSSSAPKGDTRKERRSPTEAKRPKNAAFLNDFNSNVDELDPGEYFRAIPPDIRPTRVPGTNETYPIALVLGLFLLVLLNAGAIGLLALNFS